MFSATIRRHISRLLGWNTKAAGDIDYWLKKDEKKKWSSLPHRGDIKAKPSQGCWLASTSAASRDNEHVISSRFQLEQDTDGDSCTLKCLHLRIPRRYQMPRRLRQTRLVPWQSAAGHGLEVTPQSICCAYHTAGIERFDDTASFDEMDVVEDGVKILFRDTERSLLARQSQKKPVLHREEESAAFSWKKCS